MKKVFLLIVAMSLMVISVYAIDNSGIPKWSEFCPAEYEYPQVLSAREIETKAQDLADEKTKVFYCKSDRTVAKVVRGITVLPALDCWAGNKMAKSSFRNLLYTDNENNKYWLNRKQQFINELRTCEGMSNDGKAMCYQKVRELELKKNNDLNNNAYNQAMLYQQRIRDVQQTNQMIQMNQQLQNINTNLRY